MRDPGWLLASVEAPNSVADMPVGSREALPLPQVLEPRLSHKCLVDVRRVGRILISAPTDRAVPQPYIPQLMDCLGKSSVILRINLVVDGNPDRPLAVFAFGR